VNVGSCGNTLKEIEWKNNEKKKKRKKLWQNMVLMT
jgi:hypothetical protein